MKSYKQIIFILVIFLKTETLFSENNLFNVNNIQLEKKENTTNQSLSNQAIKKGFDQLISKILLKQDKDKLTDLKLESIKKLVSYYQIKNVSDEKKKEDLVNFSVTFDKDKMHKLFYQKGISYSEISDKELYILPLLIKNNEIFIFNNNFFYKKWNEIYNEELIEFILPLEKIEIIQIINNLEKNLIELNIEELFKEYTNKNLALVMVYDNKLISAKVFIKTIIQEKEISKSINLKNSNLSKNDFYKKIIIETKKELTNIVKSKNLIDIRTPSFLNVKLDLNKNSNLVKLNLRIKKIDAIENVIVNEFNKDFMNLRIKYLGKLEKIINQLKKENINLELINDQWIIKTL